MPLHAVGLVDGHTLIGPQIGPQQGFAGEVMAMTEIRGDFRELFEMLEAQHVHIRLRGTESAAEDEEDQKAVDHRE